MNTSDNATVTEDVETSGSVATNDDSSQQETSEATQPEATQSADDTPADDTPGDDSTAASTAVGSEPVRADTSGTAAAGRKAGPIAGAGAILSSAIGLCSLTGTPLTEMLRTHAQISGQIDAQTGGGGDQVDMLYSTPWHTAALTNSFIAVVAVLIGCAVLAAILRAQSRLWVRAVALSGVVLGLLGLLVSGGMYFDLFVSPPEMPTMPGPGGGMPQ